MINGILNIYKEAGFTSHDVVAKLRGITKQKKIGHTGTLDPAARGVLPVCLGNATKVCELITDWNKTYEAVLLLGQMTDTQDTTGTVLSEKPVQVTEEQVREAVLSFLGEYAQIPPMYSALKQNGKKLYELAREGKEVERAPRLVRILELEILKIELPRVWLSVTCSKGTYIRTLCHDIGMRLECGGCMESLIRTRVGCFEQENSLRLSEIEVLMKEGNLLEQVTSVDALFMHYGKLVLKPEGEKMLYNGNPFTNAQVMHREQESEGAKGQFRVYDSKGSFVGIYCYVPSEHRYRPVKMFL